MCQLYSVPEQNLSTQSLNSGALNKTTNGWGVESPKLEMELQHELPWTMLRYVLRTDLWKPLP